MESKSPYLEGIETTDTRTMVRVEFLMPKQTHAWFMKQCRANNASLPALLQHLLAKGLEAVMVEQPEIKPDESTTP